MRRTLRRVLTGAGCAVLGIVVGKAIVVALHTPMPVPLEQIAPIISTGPRPPPPRAVETDTELVAAARAYGHIGHVLDRDGFTLRGVRCWPEANYHLCALCSTGPQNELGATLVKCDAKQCYWPLDASEWDRLGWNGEEECAIRDEEQ